MKDMKVLGLALKDYSVKEAMRMVDSYFTDSKADIVCFLSMDSILEADSDLSLKEWLEEVDLTIPISPEILKAAGIRSRQRIREVEESRFYSELMKKLSDERRTVFILATTHEEEEKSREYLRTRSEGAQVVGSFAYEELTGDSDLIVNEINSTFPDVVIVRLPSNLREVFVRDNRSMINAKLIVILKDGFSASDTPKSTHLYNLKEFIKKSIFRRKVMKYESDKEKK